MIIGLLQKAQTAKERQDETEELELIKLAVSAAQVAGEGTISAENLSNELKAIFNDKNVNIYELQDGWNYKNYKINKFGKVDNLLPEGYTMVKYLESSGHQAIDTLIPQLIESNDVITIDMIPLSNSGYMLGNYLTEFSQSGLTLNERKIYTRTHRAGISYADGLIMKLFALGNSTTPSTGSYYATTTKIYSATFIKDDVVVRDYIPVLDNLNKPAMYDKISQQPFYNKGTGEFGYELMDGTYVSPQ